MKKRRLHNSIFFKKQALSNIGVIFQHFPKQFTQIQSNFLKVHLFTLKQTQKYTQIYYTVQHIRDLRPITFCHWVDLMWKIHLHFLCFMFYLIRTKSRIHKLGVIKISYSLEFHSLCISYLLLYYKLVKNLVAQISKIYNLLVS